MIPKLLRRAIFAVLSSGMATSALSETPINPATIEKGRYLISISGCNDCHTPGYPESGGTLPTTAWLTSNPVGFQGPWGTTYPKNLRLLMQSVSADEWLKKARTEMRPPMPWFALRDLKDDDLLAIYHFVRSLGPAGDTAPAYSPPGQAVSTPYFEFVPKNLPMHAQASKK